MVKHSLLLWFCFNNSLEAKKRVANSISDYFQQSGRVRSEDHNSVDLTDCESRLIKYAREERPTGTILLQKCWIVN